MVLSNHVPELPNQVQQVGLAPLLTRVFTSAATGYEKPPPRAFAHVKEGFPQAAAIWMIGDNPVADIAGAAAVGISGMLVRKQANGVRWHCPDLTGVELIICTQRVRC